MNAITKRSVALCFLSVLVLGWSPSYSDESGGGTTAHGGAGEEQALAIGDWSEVVDGLRGRLLVIAAPLPEAPLREPVVYLELESTRAKAPSRNVYFNPRLPLVLRDPNGEKVEHLGQGGSGRRVDYPEPCWIRLPFDSRMRLRLSSFAVETDDSRFALRTEDGLRLNVGNAEWYIKWSDKGAHALSGDFASVPPVDAGGEKSWSGTLALPAVKLKAPKR